MILEDLHTHTSYCDGKDSPEEMIKEAIKKGLCTIGFSGHIFLTYGTSWCMSKDNTERYIAEINALKEKYKNKIKVLCGIETDLYSDEDLSRFDYVIGSVHGFKVGDAYFEIDNSAEVLRNGIDRYFCGDANLAAEHYFCSVVECIKKTDADIIGHFDLITKFRNKDRLFDEAHPRYIDAYQRAVDELIPMNKPFEINMGAISRGYRTTPYPSVPILKYIASKGGKVIMTGDTHAKENLCYSFEKFENLANDCGFDKVCYAEDILSNKHRKK